MTMTNTMHKTVYATQATKVKGQKLYAVTCYDTEDHAKLGTFTFNAKAKAEAWRAWFLTFEDLPKAQPLSTFTKLQTQQAEG
jgi:hypothetical protein